MQSVTEIRSLIWARADQQLAGSGSSNLVPNQASSDFNGDLARAPGRRFPVAGTRATRASSNRCDLTICHPQMFPRETQSN